MTTHPQTNDGATVFDIAGLLAKRREVAAPPSPVGTIRLGREQQGTEVEKVHDAAPRILPLWLRAARGSWGVAKTTGLGVGTTTKRVWRYQQAATFTDQIHEAKVMLAVATDPAERKALHAEIGQLEVARQQLAHDRHRENRTLTGLGVGAGVALTLVIATVLLGLVVPAGAAAIGGGAAYLAGRKENQRRDSLAAIAAPAGQVELAPGGPTALTPAVPGVYTPEQLPEGRPFPIARATSEAEAAECILRALVKEGVPVGDVSKVERTAWGWQCIVRVVEGTPGAIIQKADSLETLLDTGQGGVRVQPLVERRACAKFRIVLSDPFASAPPPEYRAAKSMSITDRGRIGSSIDGDPLEVTLAGVMGEVIAASGGGKTGILQALAELTTACRDAITIDLDPAGDGLEDLGPAARLQGRTQEQIEHVLLFLLMLAKARARLRKRLGMGRKWVASPEHPAIVVFIDEYPKLSKLAKKLAFELLLVGRKEEIPVEIASQGGTRAYLGENIAQMLALRLVGPCKVDDTRAVFGDGSAAEGYLPHRLSPATATDPRDAGHIYAQGVPGTQDAPIEYKIHEHPKGQLARLAEERRDAGLLDPDVDSLAGMASVDLPDYVLPEFDVEGNLRKEAPVELLTWEQLLRLCEADPPAAEVVTPDTPARETARKALAVLDERGVDRARTEPLAEALKLGPETLRGLLRELGVEPAQLGAWDGKANPRGYKREDLERAL